MRVLSGGEGGRSSFRKMMRMRLWTYIETSEATYFKQRWSEAQHLPRAPERRQRSTGLDGYLAAPVRAPKLP